MSLKKHQLFAVMSNGRRTLASVESLAVPLVQEVVFLADYRCSTCQQRVAETMAKIKGEIQSVVISVLEKKVTVIYGISRHQINASVEHNYLN